MRLKGFKASFLDWLGWLAAVIDEIATGETPTFIVGHSFGGHAFGPLPNHYKISGMYVFATGAGWRGWMTRRESMRVNLLWNAILPALTFFKGYTPMSMLEWVKICLMGSISSKATMVQISALFLMTQLYQKNARKNLPNKGAYCGGKRGGWFVALPKSQDAFMQAIQTQT